MTPDFKRWVSDFEFWLTLHYFFGWQSPCTSQPNLPRNGSGANSNEPGIPEPTRTGKEGEGSERAVAVHRADGREQPNAWPPPVRQSPK